MKQFLLLLPWLCGFSLLVSCGCDNGFFGDDRNEGRKSDEYELVWSYPAPDNAFNYVQPAIDGDRVYTAADTTLRAHELDTGEVIWNTILRSRRAVSTLKLIQDDGRVFVNDAYWVKAYAKTDGRQLWEKHFDYPEYNFDLSIMVQDARHLYLSGDDWVVRLDKATGKIDWQRSFKLENTADTNPSHRLLNPAISDDGWLYLASDYEPAEGRVYKGYVYCLNAKTGAVRWRYEIPTPRVPAPNSPVDSLTTDAGSFGAALSGERVIFPAGASVFALDRHTGTLLWDRLWEQDGFNLGKTIAADEEHAYVGSVRGYVRALDAETGETVWKVQAGASITTRPVLHGGRVYQFNNSGSGLWVMDAATGEVYLRRGFPPDDGYATVPAVGEGMMVLGGNEGIYGLTAPE